MNEKIRHLREKLKSRNLDGMIVSNPVNIRYLTNIQDNGILLITRKENVFLTYTMYLENVQATLTISDEVIVADFRDIDKDEYENFFLFCENIGFEEDFVTYKDYQYLKQKFKINNLEETDFIVEKLREVKEEDEINNIRKACEITDDCFKHLKEFIKTGQTEKEIALEIEMFFKTHGADGLAFETIVAAGENSAIPHWIPTDRKVGMAEPILIDMGCTVNGYTSDMTRMIFIGCILEEIKPVYDLVLKNQESVMKQLTEYTSIKSLVQMVESDFKLNNYSFIHALGHGVGLQTHERPYISTRNDTFLKENMVIASEPGIYLPGKYGIRIEDTILVTKNGYEVLTKSPKTYTVI